jgi:penicillin-binding protein 2
MGLATLCFFIILGRFFYLQVIEGGRYEELSRIHHVGRERLPARRGVIKDSRGRPVARNIANHQLSIIPHYFKHADKELALLRDLLAWSDERVAEVKAKLAENADENRRFNKVVVERGLVSTRCPHDQAELELTEPHSERWCSQCGRHLLALDANNPVCEAGHRLDVAEHGEVAACSKCGTEHSSLPTCPYDGNALEDRTTILRCPVCKRRFNNEEAVVRSHLHDLPGVYIDTEMRRHYPDRDLLGHVLGYMNQVNAKDIEQHPDTYKAGDFIGRVGVERSFEDVLRGEHGIEVFVKDARGLRLDEHSLPEDVSQAQGRPAQNGQNVWLTIDMDLQRIARAALRYHRSGAIVVMDPHTGEVLAMHSKPGYDPNVWSGRLTAQVKSEYDNNPYAPMLNKATTGYAPGSIYKVITALAGLREGVIDYDTEWDCPGYYEFGGRRFRCHKRSGHGPDIHLDDSLILSCDVYYYILGETLGMDRLQHYAHDVFLLGQKTGIDISEQPGRVPSKDWYRKYGSIGWQPGFTLSTAVGQGAVTTSPLQMARLYSALVNGGIVYRPLIVRQFEDENGNVTRRFRPEIQATLPFEQKQLEAIQQALVSVVNDVEHGTAAGIRMDSLVIAGKTGTAEAKMVVRGANEDLARWLEQDHAWFAGYAPAADPQIVVAVFVEHGGSGGKVAAPVARTVIEEYFKRGLGVIDLPRPDDPEPPQSEAPLGGDLGSEL